MPRIAVVDDDGPFREALADLMVYAGFAVTQFDSAAAALRSDDLGVFEAFMLDVQMPKMNGLELLGALRSQGVLAPVIFVTSRCDEATRDLAQSAGALALFSKPFESEALIALMRQTLKPA